MRDQSTEREFPTLVLLSVTTRRFLCKEFREIHEAIEFVAGRSVQTIELANELFISWVADRIRSQHPDLCVEVGDKTEAELREWRERVVGELGARRMIRRETRGDDEPGR